MSKYPMRCLKEQQHIYLPALDDSKQIENPICIAAPKGAKPSEESTAPVTF
jgi:hypothetical protein